MDLLEVTDELGSQPAAGLTDQVTGSDLGEQCLGLGRGEVLLRPPGRSSSSSACSWDTLRVCSSPSERRSASIRITVSWSSATTGRSPAIRVPTNATECASVASVLRPWPVEKTRARAESFGGTSTTAWPAAMSRTATCRPIPLHPSIAQTRSGHCFT
jgi:hypothetical protein